jgi:hypothetical protein
MLLMLLLVRLLISVLSDVICTKTFVEMLDTGIALPASM